MNAEMWMWMNSNKTPGTKVKTESICAKQKIAKKRLVLEL